MKRIFKIISCATVIALFFVTSCEKDQSVGNEVEAQQQIRILKGTIVQGDKLFEENKNLDIFLRSRFDSRNNINSEDVSSDIYGFAINTQNVQVISSDTYTSYTFEVKRETYDLYIAENYVLTIYDHGGYSQILVTYPLVEVNGRLQYDMQTATVLNISDANLLQTEISPCNNVTEEIVEWDDNAGTCINFNCRPPSGDGTHEPGDNFNAQAGDRAYTECSGGWVVTGCIQFGGGGSGGSASSGNPTGGGGNSDPVDPVEEEEVPVVPVIPAWQQIVNCMNNSVFSSLGGNGLDPLSDAEVSWLQTATRLIIGSMLGFLDQNSCSVEAASFNDVAIDELINGSEVVFDEKIILESSLDNYPCQKKIIIDSYSLRTPILDLFRDIFENDAVIDPNGGTLNITYKAENIGNAFYGAYTNGNPSDNNFSFKTVFNTQALESATDLKIVGTTIHEAIHAVLLHYYYTGGLVVTVANADPTYKELVEAFIEKRQQIGDTNISQHTYMTGLKNLIADGIYTWATTKSNYTDAQFADYDSNPNDEINDGLLQYCRMLAWAGLTDTQIFDELYPPFPINQERLAIENIIAQEILSGTEARGTKASTLNCND